MRTRGEPNRRKAIGSSALLLLLAIPFCGPAVAKLDASVVAQEAPRPTLTNLKIASARSTKLRGADFDVLCRINKAEGRRLRDFTSRHVGRFMRVIVNGRPVTSVRINEPIAGPVFWISGDFSEPDAKRLAEDLSGRELTLTIEP